MIGETYEPSETNGETQTPTVDTVTEEIDDDTGEQSHPAEEPTPMDSIPLKDLTEPIVETIDEEELTGVPTGEKKYYTEGVDSL